MGNKYILVVSIIGLLICTFTGCSNLDSKKNKFDQQVNLAAKNKVQDKVDSKHLGNKFNGIEPTNTESGDKSDKIQPTATNSEDETDENEQALLVTLKKKIHKSLPEYIFKIYGEKDNNFLMVRKIKIYEEQKEEKLIQEINSFGDSNAPDYIENAGVEFVDANFDGYLDLQVLTGMGVGPVVSYSYWLWDKDKLKFMSDQELSGMPSPKFDKLNKTITSEITSGAGAHYEERVYKFLDGKLTLIKETIRTVDFEKNLFILTVKELVNNEMKVIEQHSEPLE